MQMPETMFRTVGTALCLLAAGLVAAVLPADEAGAQGLALPRVTDGTVSPQPKLPRPDRYHRRRHHGARRHAGQLLILTERIHPLDRLERPEERATPPPDPVETPPVEIAEPDPADPRAPSLRIPARGQLSAAPDTPQTGQRLSRRVPQVTLHWRSYDLPEPPVGALYVRVGRQILLIDQTDRRVLGHYDPELGTLEPDPGAG